MTIEKSDLLHAVAIASSGYFAGNPVPEDRIEGIVRTFFKVLAEGSDSGLMAVERAPAVPISEAISEDEITCLECGKSMRSLKIHLRTLHGLSANQYRAKWGLPENYPMMPPSASALRSETSKRTQEIVQADPTIPKGGKRRRTAPTE